jgi:hypothetical protein
LMPVSTWTCPSSIPMNFLGAWRSSSKLTRTGSLILAKILRLNFTWDLPTSQLMRSSVCAQLKRPRFMVFLTPQLSDPRHWDSSAPLMYSRIGLLVMVNSVLLATLDPWAPQSRMLRGMASMMSCGP